MNVLQPRRAIGHVPRLLTSNSFRLFARTSCSQNEEASCAPKITKKEYVKLPKQRLLVDGTPAMPMVDWEGGLRDPAVLSEPHSVVSSTRQISPVSCYIYSQLYCPAHVDNIVPKLTRRKSGKVQTDVHSPNDVYCETRNLSSSTFVTQEDTKVTKVSEEDNSSPRCGKGTEVEAGIGSCIIKFVFTAHSILRTLACDSQEEEESEN